MSTISIQDLNPVGSDLLNDEESFLNELNDLDGDFVKGGIAPIIATSMSVVVSYVLLKLL